MTIAKDLIDTDLTSTVSHDCQQVCMACIIIMYKER